MDTPSKQLIPTSSETGDDDSLAESQFKERRPSKRKIVSKKGFLMKLFPIFCNSCLFTGLIASIVFGIRKTPIHLAQEQLIILGKPIKFSEDFQLLVIGVLSKVIDYCLNMSIEHLAGITITSMMIANFGVGKRHGTTPRGVTSLDLELANEMTKPWLALYNFYKRVRIFGFAKVGVWGGIKFLLTLLVGLTVLLMTAAINTVALPKQRWTSPTIYCTPATRITALNYSYYDNQAYNIGLSFTNVDSRAAALIATQSWIPTENLWYAATNSSYWQQLYETDSGNSESLPRYTAIRAYQNETTTFTVRLRTIQNMYTRAGNSTDYFGRVAQGFAGIFNITVPTLITTCEDLSDPQENDTFSVRKNPTDPTSRPSLQIILGPSQSSGFKGANCSLQFQQMLFTPTGWAPSSSDATIPGVYLDRDMYGNYKDYPTTVLPVTEFDAGIVESLVNTLNTTLPIIDRFTNGFVSFMALLVNIVDGRYPDSPTGAAAVAPGIAAIAQQTMSLGTFTDIDLDNEICSEFRWEVYGSGPRIPWQWVIGAFLGFGILIAFIDFLAWLNPMVYVAEWIDLSGMLALANNSPRLDVFHDDKEAAERTLLYVVETSSGDVELRERNPFRDE
ncbi:hypothetical protein TWF694_000922 [Orbilia ellipsospora]|uniref:Uncharacterized protein n=1 Tax=Orbilia ellipsospora TaxID=2528407 RepID=A0AAV9XQG0_9PEZI